MRNKIIIIIMGVILAWFFGFHYFRKPITYKEFHDAITQRDFSRAEMLWSQGVRAGPKDPYAGFMQILDCLHRIKSLEIVDWNVRENAIIDDVMYYNGTIGIKDSNPGGYEFGLGVKWEGEEWRLISDIKEIPDYVKACIKKTK